jgi:hypothetical protein
MREVAAWISDHRRISFDTWPALCIQDARAHLYGLNATGPRCRSQPPPAHYKKLSKQAAEKLFRSVAERWYKRKEVADRANSTHGKMRTYLDKNILPEIGSMMLEDITHTTRQRAARTQEAERTPPLSFPGIGTKNEVISENTINLVFSKIG